MNLNIHYSANMKLGAFWGKKKDMSISCNSYYFGHLILCLDFSTPKEVSSDQKVFLGQRSFLFSDFH